MQIIYFSQTGIFRKFESGNIIIATVIYILGDVAIKMYVNRSIDWLEK